MDGSRGPLAIEVVDKLADIEAAAWASCAGSANPFVGYTFLKLLEDSKSVGGKSGWSARHLVARDEAGTLVGAVPMYLKAHSYGEYIFDQGWAQAYERAGGRYYPKLLVAVPFTPVTGPRLLVRPDGPEGTAEALAEALEQIATDGGLSSLPTEDEYRRLGARGWLQRLGVQFHWENRGYQSFEDFLGALSSRKRKAIRKERREVAESGVELHTFTGAALKEEHWDAFYEFYQATSDRKWGWAYLTREFFHLLGERMADQVVLVMAKDGRHWVAGALNLLGADTLYGRNWGSRGDYKMLHFEACYYRALDFAIERGLARVEAGAQGQHKIQRGYLPTPTYSAHYITNPSLRRAIADHLKSERRAVAHEIELLAEESPYRKPDGDAPGSADPKSDE
jgi:predicted N-acyltransferase